MVANLIFISAFAAGDAGAIHTCALDGQTGALKLLTRSSEVEHPFSITFAPNHRFLYSIHAPTFGSDDLGEVIAFRIENGGELTPLNRQSTGGTSSSCVAVDTTGHTLIVTNYSSGNVSALPIREDGSLGEARTQIQHAGSSVHPVRQTVPHAHSVVISPDNRFAFVADLGLDQIRGYRLDAERAGLSPLDPPFVSTSPGCGPRHLSFHPDGAHLYAINELNSSVTMFDYAPATGAMTPQQTISTLPNDFDTIDNHTADLKITPNGRFLFGTNRGHDSIVSYALDAGGRMTRIGFQPSLGKRPENLLITPDGRWLVCGNQASDNVAVFSIDAENGTLRSVSEPIAIPKPASIQLLPI